MNFAKTRLEVQIEARTQGVICGACVKLLHDHYKSARAAPGFSVFFGFQTPQAAASDAATVEREEAAAAAAAAAAATASVFERVSLFPVRRGGQGKPVVAKCQHNKAVGMFDDVASGAAALLQAVK